MYMYDNYSVSMHIILKYLHEFQPTICKYLGCIFNISGLDTCIVINQQTFPIRFVCSMHEARSPTLQSGRISEPM